MTIETKDSAQAHQHPARVNGQNGNGSHGPAGHEALHAPRQRPWPTRDDEALYRVQDWGNGYFSVNGEGHVAVHPTQNRDLTIDLKRLVDELRERDIQPPLLVRFTDILKTRV